MKIALIILTFALNLNSNNGYSQIDSTFVKILKSVFDDLRISDKVLNRNDDYSIYLYANPTFVSRVKGYEVLYKKMSNGESTMTPLFKSDKGTVNLFLIGDILNLSV